MLEKVPQKLLYLNEDGTTESVKQVVIQGHYKLLSHRSNRW
jgi:hypothetical protein